MIVNETTLQKRPNDTEINSSVADPELFLKGGGGGGADWPKGARSSHASMVPYIINQIFPTKVGARATQPPFGSVYAVIGHRTAFNNA